MTRDRGLVGIDVSKRRLDVFLLDSGERRAFANDAAGRGRLLGWLAGQAQCLALEPSGGYERALLAEATTAGLTVYRLDALRVRRFAEALGRPAKTDRIDAQTIARFAATLAPRAHVREPARERLQEMVSLRRFLSEERSRSKLRLESLEAADMAAILKRRLKALEDDIAGLETKIAELIAAEPALQRKAAILRSVPGVGPVLCACLLAWLPELGSLSRRQVAALVGLAPITWESGTLQKKRAIKGGRSDLRRSLYMPTLSAIRCNQDLANFATRLRENGKPPKVAITAAMRKLITLLNALVRDDRKWSPKPNTA